MESKHHNIMYFPYQTARTVLRNYSILVSYNFSVIVQRESAWLATPSGVERTWLATPSPRETETVDGIDMMSIDYSAPFDTIIHIITIRIKPYPCATSSARDESTTLLSIDALRSVILRNSECTSVSVRGLPHLLGWRDVGCHTFTHGY